MKVYDITQTIEETMIVYKNKPEKRPVIAITRDHALGGVRESSVTLDVHTGTHLDAPLHMLPEGETIDSIDLHQLITPCRVLDLSHLERGIEASDLEPYQINIGEVVLFKTRNSHENFFNPDFIYLTENGASYLVSRGVRGIGTDGLGIERAQPGHPTHRQLFGAGVYIIEGLALGAIVEGTYTLVALPLKLKGLDAAPVRAILIDHLSL